MIFRYPNNPKILYLKRIIGEPGDKVEMTGRTVYINGKSLKEDYVRYIDPSSVDQHYGPLNIPPESYFVLGDNRDNSADSRFWGCVPKKNLIGKPLFIYWSFEAPKDEYLRSEPSDKLKQLGDRILHIFTKTRWSRTFRVIE
jgi:signal peptidase I